MNNHDRAMIMYKDIQRRKKQKEEGERQAETYCIESACRSINRSAKWRSRNPRGCRRID